MFPHTKILLFAVIIALASACQENEFEEIARPVDPELNIQDTQIDIGSITIVGENTLVKTLPDCETCTFVVQEDNVIIDGDALNLEPGSIICLKTGVQYGDLTFVNLRGTPEHPITIAQGVN